MRCGIVKPEKQGAYGPEGTREALELGGGVIKMDARGRWDADASFGRGEIREERIEEGEGRADKVGSCAERVV